MHVLLSLSCGVIFLVCIDLEHRDEACVVCDIEVIFGKCYDVEVSSSKCHDAEVFSRKYYDDGVISDKCYDDEVISSKCYHVEVISAKCYDTEVLSLDSHDLLLLFGNLENKKLQLRISSLVKDLRGRG
ncbi:hypothetical protein H5410_036695 [Solanum commersonii]|uniref:Uncharacterized protein n=1 Tax=Solanum commersonii TaxID=4109 RepID=A0A9J5Y6E0_SOLCO|nr:hypothetical protein H5410_036695 [Solanum commersonii]